MSGRLNLAALRRSARWTGIRSRLGDGIRRGVVSLPVVLVYGVGALTFIKVGQPSGEVQFWLGLVGGALVAVWTVLVLVSLLRRRPRGHGGLLLDRHHQLDGRLANALEFSELPAEQQSPLMRVAIADALGRIQKLSPRRAAPFPIPRELGIVMLLTAGLLGVALLEVRVLRYVPPSPNNFKPMVMTGDDLELFRDLAKELQDQGDDPETLAAVRRFNQLIEDISQRRLERREVFQRLANLERDLTKAGEAEREATEEGLEGLARELEKADLSKPVADALKEKRLADAEKAMQELAEKLKNKRQPPSKAQLERLRKSLERASKATSERSQSLLEQKEEIEKEKKRLLDKKKKGEELSKSEQKKLDQLERQLERLDREKQKSERAQKQMSELDKKLAEAARDLMQAQGQDASAEDLQQAAEDLNRMAKKEMTEQQKRELLKRLQEMREILRQQGAGGQKRMQRMMRFGQRARGQSGQPGGEQPGQGQGQQGQGQGQGQAPGEVTPMLVPGRGGVEIPMAGEGQSPGQGQGQGQGQGSEQPGGGGGLGGKQWGSGHDDKLAGEGTDLKGQTKDVVAAGVDTGQGNASSEVIYGAAQRGFVGRGYQKVYTDYQTVAERVMNQDEIPPGYRFYVRRYFQLIRPRE